jgi:hypothetical protein
MADVRYLDAILGDGIPEWAPAEEPAPGDEDEALDAYSQVITRVAEVLSPSVANLRVSRRSRGFEGEGGGSAVAITPDGFILTSAHVVEGTDRGVASFVDGRELTVEVVGSDPLSDLAVLRTESNDLAAAELGDAETAIRYAEQIDTSNLPEVLRSRRAQVHIDAAWAYSQRKDDAAAVINLMEAEHVAPQVLRYNVLARDIIRALLRRERRSATPGLRAIATRAGLLQ